MLLFVNVPEATSPLKPIRRETERNASASHLAAAVRLRKRRLCPLLCARGQRRAVPEASGSLQDALQCRAWCPSERQKGLSLQVSASASSSGASLSGHGAAGCWWRGNRGREQCQRPLFAVAILQRLRRKQTLPGTRALHAQSSQESSEL